MVSHIIPSSSISSANASLWIVLCVLTSVSLSLFHLCSLARLCLERMKGGKNGICAIYWGIWHVSCFSVQRATCALLPDQPEASSPERGNFLICAPNKPCDVSWVVSPTPWGPGSVFNTPKTLLPSCYTQISFIPEAENRSFVLMLYGEIL